jgi:dihydroorotate dehydrogenase electron transfer subunit
MQYIEARIHERRELGTGYSWIKLEGCGALEQSRPGQFAMLRGSWGRDPLLPRAYSVLWVEGDAAEFLVHRVGRGSELLGNARPGDVLSVLGPLGTSFPEAEAGVTDLLVGGGCGLAPLYLAARKAARGHSPEVLVGARCREELVLIEDLRGRGLCVRTITEDGSSGGPGLVTDLLKRRLRELLGDTPSTERSRPGSDIPPEISISPTGQTAALRVFSCGPKGMLLAVRALSREHGIRCFLSLEAPMACGMGVCLGCAVEGSQKPYVYVCREGPVFDAEEVWP